MIWATLLYWLVGVFYFTDFCIKDLKTLTLADLLLIVLIVWVVWPMWIITEALDWTKNVVLYSEKTRRRR